MQSAPNRIALRDSLAAELAAPHDQRFVGQPATLQIGKQCGERAGDLGAVDR